MFYFSVLLLFFHCFDDIMANQEHFDFRNHENWPKEFESECGISYTDKIIGGKNATLGQYPWLARIGYQRRNGMKYNCGGVLLTRWYILSAAHCVTNLEANVILKDIALGEHNALTQIDCEDGICADPVQHFSPGQIIMPPNYNQPPFKHDIALIKLNKPARLTEWVLPICIPSGDLLSRNYIGEIAEVAGWGLTDSDDDDGTPFLKTVKLPILRLFECTKNFGNSIDVSDEQLCVGGLIGKDSCAGDSGGPLVKVMTGPNGTRYYLLGIVSFGSKRCGETTVPGIYTNTNHYISWILNNLYV